MIATAQRTRLADRQRKKEEHEVSSAGSGVGSGMKSCPEG